MSNDEPVSDERARQIVEEVNANNALEGIRQDDATDKIMFEYLTGRITEQEQIERTRDRLRRIAPDADPEAIDQYGSSAAERTQGDTTNDSAVE